MLFITVSLYLRSSHRCPPLPCPLSLNCALVITSLLIVKPQPTQRWIFLVTLPAAMSIDAGDTSDTVCFPHREHVDFVIHYDSKDFHVHKQILHHHSAYFRAYFLTLSPPPSRSKAPKRRRAKRSSTPLSEEEAETCNHPSVPHCIHLPQQTTLVAETVVTAACFDLFLRHLYFSAHYCYPPYLPKTDVELSADPSPLSHTFPPITSLEWGVNCPLRCTDVADTDLDSRESLLCLAHYLDCAAMITQCEAVLLTKVAGSGWEHTLWLATHSVQWLLLCDRYKLDKAKKACIAAIAVEAKHVLDTDAYKLDKQKWDKALVLEVMEAAIITSK